ncbi:CTD kinase subunit alpha [Fusarium oxysporum f. sp. rapae]|uniref:CTD kinase subunit alpha n=1 Tax=Fusarium oxysporum f. sp. rapae TaxID=485398 RepID=A0A8J5NG57_FUSOX|nr:CTD kinase subunit alpha [Fusarium oxysporum f. sp. rapae]
MATRRKRPRTRFIEAQDELARSSRPTIVGYNPDSSHNGIPIGSSIGSYDSVLTKANPCIPPAHDPPVHGLRHNSEKRLQIAGNSSEEHYKTFFTMIIGRSKVDAAYRRSNTYGPVRDNGPKSAWLKEVSGENAEKQLQIAQSIGHENFVRQLAVYEEREGFVVAYEFVPMSLSEVVANMNLSGSELATILKQVIGGLLYLEQHGLCHAQLTCSDILINHEGNVKIWGHQYYESQSSAAMVDALCVLTAQLMSGREGIQQPETVSYGRWQDHADFIDFFQQMLAARSDQSHGSTATKCSLERLSRVWPYNRTASWLMRLIFYSTLS